MLLCQELIFLKRHFKQDAVVDVAVLLVNNSRQFGVFYHPISFRYSHVSRNVSANLVFDSHLAKLSYIHVLYLNTVRFKAQSLWGRLVVFLITISAQL